MDLSLAIVESITGLAPAVSNGTKAGEVGDTFGMTNGAETSLDNSKNLNGEDMIVCDNKLGYESS